MFDFSKHAAPIINAFGETVTWAQPPFAPFDVTVIWEADTNPQGKTAAYISVLAASVIAHGGTVVKGVRITRGGKVYVTEQPEHISNSGTQRIPLRYERAV